MLTTALARQGVGYLVWTPPLEDLCRQVSLVFFGWVWFLQHGPESAAREQGSIGRLFKLETRHDASPWAA